MKKILSTVFLMTLALMDLAHSASELQTLSHRRHPADSFVTTYRSFLSRLPPSERKTFFETETPIKVSVPLEEWKGLHRIPEYTELELLRAFAHVRDSRFIWSVRDLTFPRRLSWLYPDDGCWVRAALMKQKMEQLGLPAPRKMFVFGNLTVRTSNSPKGSVSWWYHVVPIVRVQGEPIVLDPAINPRAPMHLLKWLAQMSSRTADFKIADCAPQTYGPRSLCANPSDVEEKGALEMQKLFLIDEWDRVVELGRDPVQELGTLPPWPVDMRDRNPARPY